jgi:hypothetical protein
MAQKFKPYPSEFVHIPASSDNTPIDSKYLPGLYKRENLKVKFKNRGKKTITFIMINPSEANGTKMDTTVENIIRFLRKNPNIPVHNEVSLEGVGALNVVNLFSVYNTDSGGLQKYLNTIKAHPDSTFFKHFLKSNRIAIKKAIRNTDYIVLAWGIPNGNYNQNLYFNQIFKVLRYIKKLKVKMFSF